jgi:hypothetical protein
MEMDMTVESRLVLVVPDTMAWDLVEVAVYTLATEASTVDGDENGRGE